MVTRSWDNKLQQQEIYDTFQYSASTMVRSLGFRGIWGIMNTAYCMYTRRAHIRMVCLSMLVSRHEILSVSCPRMFFFVPYLLIDS